MGNRFTLLTDNKPMLGLTSMHKKTLNRLQEQMSEFQFTMLYRAGKENTVADALSRNPVNAIYAMGLDDHQLRELQRKDPFIRQIFAHREGLANVPKAVSDRHLKAVLPKIDTKPDGLTYITLHHLGQHPKEALILPTQLKDIILKAAHTSRFAGHGGQFRTCQRIEQSYWWPNLQADVKKFISNCRTCAKSKNPPRFRQQHAPHVPLTSPDGPGMVVHIDLFGPVLSNATGKKYILYCTDRWSKFVDLFAIENKEAITVANALFDGWLTRYGIPEQQLISDQGGEFCTNVGKQLFKRLGITHSKTAAMHPQTNAAVENYNRELAKYLRCLMEEEETSYDWEKWLPTLRICYNSSVHRTTQATPMFLCFNHEANLPFFDLQQPQRLYSSDWGSENWIRLQKTYQLVKNNSERAEMIAKAKPSPGTSSRF